MELLSSVTVFFSKLDVIYFFSKLDFIAIFSGIIVPYWLTRITLKEANIQRLKQNESSKKQIEKQNTFVIKKDKMVFANQVILSKYDEFNLTILEYIDLNYQKYANVSNAFFHDDYSELLEIKEKISVLSLKIHNLERKIIVLLSFCPDFEEAWYMLKNSYKPLDTFILDYKEKYPEEMVGVLTEWELDDILTIQSDNYFNALKKVEKDFTFKSIKLKKIINASILKIMSNL